MAELSPMMKQYFEIKNGKYYVNDGAYDDTYKYKIVISLRNSAGSHTCKLALHIPLTENSAAGKSRSAASLLISCSQQIRFKVKNYR